MSNEYPKIKYILTILKTAYPLTVKLHVFNQGLSHIIFIAFFHHDN